MVIMNTIVIKVVVWCSAKHVIKISADLVKKTDRSGHSQKQKSTKIKILSMEQNTYIIKMIRYTGDQI